MKRRVCGPGAVILELETDPGDDASGRLRALRDALAASAPPFVHELIPGYTTLLIELRPGAAGDPRLERWLRPHLGGLPEPAPGREHRLAVRYGESADVDALSAALGLSFDEIVRRHRGADYTVAFVGFTPGFPYLLGLPEALTLPRRREPRPRIPAGAVAIADGQAGIYPSVSPGGWWVLGVTDTRLFDPGRDPPALLQTGDRVRFEAAETEPEPAAAATPAPQLEPEPSALCLVESWPGAVSLQAAPRRRVGQWGLAQAGALDPRAFEAANQLLGNPRHAPALEAIQQPLRLKSETELVAAVTGGGYRVVLDGETVHRWRVFRWPAGALLELLPDRRAGGLTGYLALRGGLAAHRYRGSASADPRGGVGGVHRPLLQGARLGLGDLAVGPPRPHPGTPRYPDRVTLRLYPGPQFARGAWARLLGSSFRTASVDRMAARLDGPPVELPRHDVRSEGSPWGAVQVPADGRPIVLLADRGRTGGYAKPAVVDPRDLWQLAQARPGTEVWFVDGREDGAAPHG